MMHINNLPHSLAAAGYLATTARCLGAMAAPTKATHSAQLNMVAHTALATMEACYMLLGALRWTEDPKLLATTLPDQACEEVYGAVSGPGMLPRLAVLVMAVVNVTEAAGHGSRPESDPAASAAVLACSSFSMLLPLIGGRLSRIRCYCPGNPGPLPAAMAHLVPSHAFMVLTVRTLSVALHHQWRFAARSGCVELLVPHWDEGVPGSQDLGPIGCSWNNVHMQLHGLRHVLEAAVKEGGCGEVDTLGECQHDRASARFEPQDNATAHC